MTDSAPEEGYGSAELLHLLTCSACRSWAIGRLLGRQTSAPQDEDTQPDLYAAIWARLEERAPEAIEQARARSERAELLLAELVQAPRADRPGLVRQPKFLSLDLLERLLEESHAGQLADPAHAAELARLAAHLASRCGLEKEAAASALPRACCLGANARRLQKVVQALKSIAKALPPPQLPVEEESVSVELRALIDCVLVDSIEPAIESLRAAAKAEAP